MTVRILSDPDKNIGVIVNVNAGTSEDGLAFNYAEDSTVPLSWWRSHSRGVY